MLFASLPAFSSSSTCFQPLAIQNQPIGQFLPHLRLSIPGLANELRTDRHMATSPPTAEKNRTLEDTAMKTACMLGAALLSVASISLVAQQPASSEPPPGNSAPPAQEQSAPPAQQAPQASQTNTPPPASAAQMSPVAGELVDKLDTKTAKAGDTVVLKTKSAVTTVDGTSIPKGSKLIGHVMGVKPSGPDNANSQVALQFDRAEVNGGQSVAIHSEIQSIAPSDNEASSTGPSSMGSMPSAAPESGAAGSNSPSRSNPSASGTPDSQTSGSGPAAANPNMSPAAGTVVARTGNIAIRTTSIPGVLLAVNEPGQQDPRMAQSSGILLGAKRDVQLEGGTNVILGVAGAASPGGN
jgi:hypothetical protein